MSTKKTFATLDEALAFITEQGATIITAENNLKAIAQEKTTLVNELKVCTTAKDEALALITSKDGQITELNGKVSTLTEDFNKVSTDLSNALNEVATLSNKLDLQEKHGSSGVIVTINKKNYQLSGNRFISKGVEKTAEELSKDTEELERMLKIKSDSLIALD